MEIMEIIQYLNNIFWGWLVAGLLLCTGIYLTCRLHFPQIRYFTRLFSNLKASLHSNENESGSISGFAALCSALGGQVGTGCFVGVATAIASGGPGAVFWMWMTALLGMPISFAEATLAQLFREKNPDGTYRGGPAYYMEKGMHSHVLSVLLSVSIMIGMGVFDFMVQTNSVSLAVTGVVDISPLFAGMVLLLFVGLVIFGGIKRLSKVASTIVPFVAMGYLVMAVYVVLTHFSLLPGMIETIFSSAFNFQSAAGGAAGYTMQEAFRYGVARGLFTNDAGKGTAPSMHATAIVPHPVNQGFAAMLGTFITTIIICSCTAFCILLSGQIGSGETGIALTQSAFESNLGPMGRWAIFLPMTLFGFTTLLADNYYGEVNLRHLVQSPKAVLAYRVICCGLVLVGAVAPVPVVWELVDFASAFMVFFNAIALWGLSKYVIYILKDYAGQSARGKTPCWQPDQDVTKLDLGKCSDEQEVTKPDFSH